MVPGTGPALEAKQDEYEALKIATTATLAQLTLEANKDGMKPQQFEVVLEG